jgi:hypothetical protein
MSAELLPPLRDYLIAQNLVRKPSVAGAKPPLWLDPRDGVPEPGAGANATEIGADVVLGAFQVMGFARPPYVQQYLRTDCVDIWIRARTAPLAYQTADPIIDALADKRQFALASLTIIECLLFRPLQRLGSDENSFDFTMQFSFERFT